MREWREVFGTEQEMPEEFDTTSSPTTIYQRRNIKRMERVEGDGTKVAGWQREERELTVEEYKSMMLMTEVVNGNKEEIVSSVTEFQKEAAIDEYTLQLIEEGLL